MALNVTANTFPEMTQDYDSLEITHIMWQYMVREYLALQKYSMLYKIGGYGKSKLTVRSGLHTDIS